MTTATTPMTLNKVNSRTRSLTTAAEVCRSNSSNMVSLAVPMGRRCISNGDRV